MLTTRRSDSFKEKAQRDQDKTNLDCFESLERNIRVSAAVALDIRNKNVALGGNSHFFENCSCNTESNNRNMLRVCPRAPHFFRGVVHL
jgi:hypothetical protein